MDDLCPAAYRKLPMPYPAFCAGTADHNEPGVVHRGHDADGAYYTWLATDDGAYEDGDR